MDKTSLIWKTFGLFIFGCLLLLIPAQAQTSASSSTVLRQDDSSLDVQLVLLHATNEPVQTKGITPSSFDSVVRQLKTTLPFTNYQLVMNFFNRVRNGGGLDLNGIGSFKVATAPAEGSGNNQSFYQYHIGRAQTASDGVGQPFIKIEGLRFVLKYPAVTGTTTTDGKNYPIIQYQDMSIGTEVNAPMGSPTLLGTIGVNKPDETYILIILVKESMK